MSRINLLKFNKTKLCGGPCGCGKEKTLNEFCVKTGQCKECRKIYMKKYREDNKEYIKKQRKEFRDSHKKEIKAYMSCYRQTPLAKESKKIHDKLYYDNNKTKIKIYKQYYSKKNKNKINENMRKKRNNNINFKISCSLRSRLNEALKRNFKTGSAVRDMGCSIEMLRIHLESKFYQNSETEEKMTWNNYGRLWHIDHVIPLSTLDLKDEDQFYRACHYTNLQPLWVKENLEKHNNSLWDWE